MLRATFSYSFETHTTWKTNWRVLCTVVRHCERREWLQQHPTDFQPPATHCGEVSWSVFAQASSILVSSTDRRVTSGSLPILLSKLSPHRNYRFSWKPTRRTPFPARTPFYRIPSEQNAQVASVSRQIKLFELIFSHGLYFETEDPVNELLVMKCGSVRECCQWFMVYLFSFAGVQIPPARGAHPSRKACKSRGMKVAARLNPAKGV